MQDKHPAQHVAIIHQSNHTKADLALWVLVRGRMETCFDPV